MTDIDEARLDFIASICDSFTNFLNQSTGEIDFCGQDSFEVLASVFGAHFTERDLHDASHQQYEQLATALRDTLEIPGATSSMAKASVQSALLQWSGNER